MPGGLVWWRHEFRQFANKWFFPSITDSRARLRMLQLAFRLIPSMNHERKNLWRVRELSLSGVPFCGVYSRKHQRLLSASLNAPSIAGVPHFMPVAGNVKLGITVL